MSGEIKLLAAVLIRAARDAVTPVAGEKEEWQRDAVSFFGLNKHQPNLMVSYENGFSFAYICEHLGLCPYRIHRELKKVEVEAKKARKAGRWLQLTKANGVHLEAWCSDEDAPNGRGFEYCLSRLGGNKKER